MGKLTIKRHERSGIMVELWEDGYLGAVIHDDNIMPLITNEQAKRLNDGEELHFKLVEVE